MNNLYVWGAYSDDSAKNYPIWHPFFTTKKSYLDFINVKYGEGVTLFDVDGNKYLDFSSGLWNVNLGYGNEKIVASVQKQLNMLPYCSLFEYTNDTAVEAANKILELLPDNINKIMFTCSGSESIDLSIKIMRAYQMAKNSYNKRKIIALKNSYHGTYYGSMSASGIYRELYKDYGPLVGEVEILDINFCSRGCEGECNAQCVKKMEEYIQQNHNNIAGILLEQVMASKGGTEIPILFMKRLIQLCYQYDILVTVDEVATGFYRSGKAFYFENYDIFPELVCMSKGINSGYLPLGAVAINDYVVNTLENVDHHLIHGSTQAGNLLACAATISTIEQYSQMNLCQKITKQSVKIHGFLEEYLKNHKNVGRINSVGYMIFIDLVNNKKDYTFLGEKVAVEIVNLMLRKGIILYPSIRGIMILPMYIASDEEIDKMLKVIVEVFGKIVF